MSKQTAIVFVSGALAVILLAGGAGAGWMAIDSHTRYLLLAALITWAALILGIIVAMAFVGVLLLFKLTWKVDVTPRIPQAVVHGGFPTQVPAYPMIAPPVQEPPPAVWRPTREWQVLGAEAQWLPPEIEKAEGEEL